MHKPTLPKWWFMPGLYLFFIKSFNYAIKIQKIKKPINDEDILYTCTCPNGCTGKNCQTCTSTQNPCSSNPCLNGKKN
jgi:hypothetical protein